MKKFLALTILLLPAISYGQVVTVDGKYPQLPSTLGANGGLKVECLSGCSGSGGATGGLTDAELRALPVVVTETTIGGVRYPFGSISFSENWLLGVAGKNISDSTYWPIPLSDGGLKIPVSISSMPSTPVTGTFWQSTQPISAASLPLPTGAATSALQITGNTDLANINLAVAGNGSGISENLMMAGVYDPIAGATSPLFGTNGTVSGSEFGLITRNIPSGTQTVAGTGTFAVTGTFWPATQPVSGTVTATGPLTDTQLRATPVPVSGTVTATGPLTDTQLRASAVPISGTVTANAGTGTMAVSGPLTDTQLRATPIFIQEGTSTRWSCFIQAATITTQCKAAPAAGQILYVTSVSMSNQAATVQTLDIVFGTGTNCATGLTALTHKWQFGTNGTTTSPFSVNATFDTPLVPTAANAICVRPSAATAFGVTITGYTGS